MYSTQNNLFYLQYGFGTVIYIFCCRVSLGNINLYLQTLFLPYTQIWFKIKQTIKLNVNNFSGSTGVLFCTQTSTTCSMIFLFHPRAQYFSSVHLKVQEVFVINILNGLLPCGHYLSIKQCHIYDFFHLQSVSNLNSVMVAVSLSDLLLINTLIQDMINKSDLLYSDLHE